MFSSIKRILFVAALLGSAHRASAGRPPFCPNATLSCHNTTVIANTCCFNAPGGQVGFCLPRYPRISPDTNYTAASNAILGYRSRDRARRPLDGPRPLVSLPFHPSIQFPHALTPHTGRTTAMEPTTRTATRRANTRT